MEHLISDGGISQPALAFFGALFTLVGIVLKMVSDSRKESRETRKEITNVSDAVNQAAESAEKAVANTQNVSNGFARTVLARLESIDEKIESVSTTVNRHMEWHVHKEEK